MPGRSENLTSRWSIDAMPLTWDVYVASRRNVVRIAGSPLTFSDHAPLAFAGDRRARERLQRGRDVGHERSLALPFAGLPGVTASPLGTASENDGLPPFGGGL